MKRFSIIDFEDEVFVLPGKVDKFMLEDFEPVTEARENLELTEILKIFYTIYQLDDGTEAGSDATAEDVDDIAINLNEYLDKGTAVVVSEGKIEMPGLLPEPFEDYYQLEGDEREEYLAAKAAAAEELERLTAACKSAGLSDEETEQWLRFNLYKSDEDKEGTTE